MESPENAPDRRNRLFKAARRFCKTDRSWQQRSWPPLEEGNESIEPGAQAGKGAPQTNARLTRAVTRGLAFAVAQVSSKAILVMDSVIEKLLRERRSLQKTLDDLIAEYERRSDDAQLARTIKLIREEIERREQLGHS